MEACQCSTDIQKGKQMQNRKLQTGKLNFSSMQTPTIITARISKRTVVFDKLVGIIRK